jgi:hypothetical protein
VQKVPGADANASKSSGNLFFLPITRHQSLTAAECKKHFLHSALSGLIDGMVHFAGKFG